MIDENTMLLGTNVDKDEGMHRFGADAHPGIRKLTEGHKPGDIVARVDFDPYYRSFRNMTTHIWATELTEESVRASLQQGRAFVSHDWMCDATGFSLEYAEKGVFRGQRNLVAHFPVACHAKLMRNGSVFVESDTNTAWYRVSEPGVYRVEGWLRLDGELRPWIYSNPVFVR